MDPRSRILFYFSPRPIIREKAQINLKGSLSEPIDLSRVINYYKFRYIYVYFVINFL